MKKAFDSKAFSDAVKEKMFTTMANEKRRIGVREFAEQIGVSSATLSRITNDNVPDIETFFTLCRWMSRSTNDFKTRE